MPNAIVPIDRNAVAAHTPAPATAPVSSPGFGYGVNPRDEVAISTPAKPITRLPQPAAEVVEDAGKRNPTWDKVANVGSKAAWGAGAALTATTGGVALTAAAGLTAGMVGPSIFLAVLAPAAIVGAVGMAAWGVGKLVNRGKKADVPVAEPAPAQGTWDKVKNVGRKIAKAGVVLTAASLVAGIVTPLALAPLVLGVAAYVGPAVAAAGGLLWGVGKAKE